MKQVSNSDFASIIKYLSEYTEIYPTFTTRQLNRLRMAQVLVKKLKKRL